MWTRSRKCIKSEQLIRQLMEKRQGRAHLSGGIYSGPARLVSQSKEEIRNDQKTHNPPSKQKNARKNLTKVHETSHGKLNEQLFPKQAGHSATLFYF